MRHTTEHQKASSSQNSTQSAPKEWRECAVCSVHPTCQWAAHRGTGVGEIGQPGVIGIGLSARRWAAHRPTARNRRAGSKHCKNTREPMRKRKKPAREPVASGPILLLALEVIIHSLPPVLFFFRAQSLMGGRAAGFVPLSSSRNQ